MILRGARVARGPNRAVRADIEIAQRGPDLDLDGHLILPGLINAHDHLEFNLFPRLGRGPHANAAEWAKVVYRPRESPVREHLRISKETRLWWGALKNLFSGVTMVCHHNPYEPRVFTRGFPIKVVRRFGWAHSLDFSPDLQQRFRRTPNDRPFIVHAAEARDGSGLREIAELERRRVLDSRTVLVHGAALDEQACRLLRSRGVALIVCPSSNLFTLGKTVCPKIVRALPCALGTDSALTGAGDLFDEIRVARRVFGLQPAEVYSMVTTAPARILRLEKSDGDFTVVRDIGRSPAETLCELRRVEIVISDGRIRLARREMTGLQPISVYGRGLAYVAADVRRLMTEARRELGGEIRLAGKRVSL